MPAVNCWKPEIKQDLHKSICISTMFCYLSITLHVIHIMFDTIWLNEECLWRIVQILQKRHVHMWSRNPSTSQCLSYLCNIEQHVVQFVLWCNGQFQNHLSVVHGSPLPFLLQDHLELIQWKMPTQVYWSAKILTNVHQSLVGNKHTYSTHFSAPNIFCKLLLAVIKMY